MISLFGQASLWYTSMGFDCRGYKKGERVTAKEYLRQLRSLDILINAMQLEKERLFAMATRVNAPLSDCKVDTSPDNSKNAELIIKVAALQDEIKKQVDDYVNLKAKIVRQVSAIGDMRYRAILTMRYVNGNTFKEIAKAMNYHEIYAVRLHGRALQEFEKKYKVVSLG